MFTRHGMRRACGVLAISLVSLPATAAAQDDDAQVIITASRLSQNIDQTLWSATVLTREEIQARQATSLPDLLSTVSGIGFDNSGGPGKSTNVRIRGAESDQTLLLIDGVRVGSATLGIP
ncbi:MAG TPA: TonB-dependent receptor plug domain-containing protein, partial [Steroidobacteraceae bacterium]